MRAVVIGLGGIGSWLADALARYLAGEKEEWELRLADGDDYEPRNAGRQSFERLANKAESQASKLVNFLPVSVFPQYVDEGNVAFAFDEGNVVFLCVDNHATRKLVLEHAMTLQDVSVYSGGNEYTDGNVWVYRRQGGQDTTPNPLSYHPELAEPTDRSPAEMSCEELAASGSPQLIVTNLFAAVLMLCAFYTDREVHEVYFDVQACKAAPRLRPPTSKNEWLHGHEPKPF